MFLTLAKSFRIIRKNNHLLLQSKNKCVKQNALNLVSIVSLVSLCFVYIGFHEIFKLFVYNFDLGYFPLHCILVVGSGIKARSRCPSGFLCAFVVFVEIGKNKHWS